MIRHDQILSNAKKKKRKKNMLQGKDLGICSPSNWLNFNKLKCHFSIFLGFSLIKITEYPECLRTNFNSGKYRRNTVSPLPRLTNHSDPVPYDTFCSVCVLNHSNPFFASTRQFLLYTNNNGVQNDGTNTVTNNRIGKGWGL